MDELKTIFAALVALIVLDGYWHNTKIYKEQILVIIRFLEIIVFFLLTYTIATLAKLDELLSYILAVIIGLIIFVIALKYGSKAGVIETTLSKTRNYMEAMEKWSNQFINRLNEAATQTLRAIEAKSSKVVDEQMNRIDNYVSRINEKIDAAMQHAISEAEGQKRIATASENLLNRLVIDAEQLERHIRQIENFWQKQQVIINDMEQLLERQVEFAKKQEIINMQLQETQARLNNTLMAYTQLASVESTKKKELIANAKTLSEVVASRSKGVDVRKNIAELFRRMGYETKVGGRRTRSLLVSRGDQPVAVVACFGFTLTLQGSRQRRIQASALEPEMAMAERLGLPLVIVLMNLANHRVFAMFIPCTEIAELRKRGGITTPTILVKEDAEAEKSCRASIESIEAKLKAEVIKTV